MLVLAFRLVLALNSIHTMRLVPALLSVCTLRLVPALTLVPALRLLQVGTTFNAGATFEGHWRHVHGKNLGPYKISFDKMYY